MFGSASATVRRVPLAHRSAGHPAWSKRVVLVAVTGNDGASSAAFPAGDRVVLGVPNADQSDTLNASPDYDAETFPAAPGTDIVTIVPGGGTTSIAGTSASSADVAAAAAMVRPGEGSLSPASSGAWRAAFDLHPARDQEVI
jgi:hypothetical protein